MEYSEDEGVVKVSWQPVVVVGGNEVEYTVSSWQDGAGDPATVYRLEYTCTSIYRGTSLLSQTL